MFKFNLGQQVVISISGEEGYVQGRAEYHENGQNNYLVFYKSADSRAVERWFLESELTAK